jgi:recombinational DNA repair protein RecT
MNEAEKSPVTQPQQKFDIIKMREQVITGITKMLENKMLVAPSNYKEEIFFTFQKLADLKDIDKCDVKNVCNEIAKIFRNDLAITKNHCALMVINSKNSQTGKALSMRWQYQGLLYVAKTKCGVKRVSPVLVFENDKFSARYIDGVLKIEHEPNFANSGSVIGGYCVVENGDIESRYYTIEELNKRRGKSQKQAIWEGGRIAAYQESNFWQDWEREMYEKTLVNATLKRIIETSGTTIEALHESESREVQEISFEEIKDNAVQTDNVAPAEKTDKEARVAIGEKSNVRKIEF